MVFIITSWSKEQEQTNILFPDLSLGVLQPQLFVSFVSFTFPGWDIF